MVGRIVGRYGARSTLAGKEQGEMGEAERRVKETDALVRETVIRLSRSGSPELLGERAHEDLLDLRPHLEEALAGHWQTSIVGGVSPTRSSPDGVRSRCSWSRPLFSEVHSRLAPVGSSLQEVVNCQPQARLGAVLDALAVS